MKSVVMRARLWQLMQPELHAFLIERLHRDVRERRERTGPGKRVRRRCRRRAPGSGRPGCPRAAAIASRSSGSTATACRPAGAGSRSWSARWRVRIGALGIAHDVERPHRLGRERHERQRIRLRHRRAAWRRSARRPRASPAHLGGTASACSNDDQIHCGRLGVFCAMCSPMSPTVIRAHPAPVARFTSAVRV